MEVVVVVVVVVVRVVVVVAMVVVLVVLVVGMVVVMSSGVFLFVFSFSFSLRLRLHCMHGGRVGSYSPFRGATGVCVCVKEGGREGGAFGLKLALPRSEYSCRSAWYRK